MALVLGTNCGFCASRPSGSPSVSVGGGLANKCLVMKDTSPAGNKIITEIGFYNAISTNSQCNFNVGIYSDDGGSPSKPSALIVAQSTGLYVAASTAGWHQYTGLSISISASTTYWIAVGWQDVETDCKTQYNNVSGARQGEDTITGPTLSTPWSATGETFYTNYALAIYAKYEDAPASGLSIPLVQGIYRRRRV